jgi:FADH2 O2-dependent halogenase
MAPRTKTAPAKEAPSTPTISTDVAIVGAHATTSLLAAALARGGRDVTLIHDPDAATPTSDLSTTPYSSELALLLADRFGVEEAREIALFENAPPALQQPSGIKTNLGFVHHRTGRAHDPHHAVQFHVPGEHAEWQPGRAALDAWALAVAERAGARVVEGEQLTRTGEDEDVLVRLGDGRSIAAGLVVDGRDVGPAAGSGARRVVSTEMIGVLPFERVVPLARHGREVRPWSTGTLTHTFPGGYVQITHHDNHGHSTQAGCGVTISVAAGPLADADGGDALLDAVCAELPDLRAQLASARRIRHWEDSHESAQAPAVGDPRVLALGRMGTVREPLLSQELTVGLELAHAAAAAILAAEPGRAQEAVAAVRRRQAALVNHHERLVAAWHGATRSFALVNATLRFWLLGSILQALGLKRARLDAVVSGDWSGLDREPGPYWFRVPASLPQIVDECLREVESAAARQTPDGAAAERIFARLRSEAIVPPLYDFGDPDARVYRFTAARRIRMLLWATTVAPKDFRRLLTRENVSGGRPKE